MSLLATLEWSEQSYGSHWVCRQTLHYLREEFLNIVNLDVFTNLPKRFFIETLKSDFLQVNLFFWSKIDDDEMIDIC